MNDTRHANRKPRAMHKHIAEAARLVDRLALNSAGMTIASIEAVASMASYHIGELPIDVRQAQAFDARLDAAYRRAIDGSSNTIRRV